ncbi:iron complex transport system substrate-binding protein [Limimonas halophila]|uniref:Iron complex transport system substrate-binding protein n=1 Tax=Limimonas halophila TaxID=1082479 RepID=A0A1G7PRY9_9PROT|nr:iron-siderophore ABC transporter substrate-binding protein [Limimonas halophila]SDF88953.1 iron complex transport system substrate-binding protein [Limimonas halophila]
MPANTCRAAAIACAVLTLLALSPSRAAGGLTLDRHAAAPVRLDGPAERVVSLVHAVTETLLVLDVPPAGVAAPAEYRRYVNIRAQALAGVTPVGRRQEPSLERIAKLEPDLIVGAEFRHGGIRERLAEIAPTLLLRFYPGGVSDRLDHMRELTRTLARAVGREGEAETRLEELDATLAAQRRQLADAGFADDRAFVASSLPGASRYRVFTRNAMAPRILTDLGLRYAWDGTPERYGFDTVGLTGLARLGEAHGLFVSHHETPPWESGPRASAWRAVPAARAGRMHLLSRDTAPFGGVATAQRFARRAAGALLSGQEPQTSSSAER